MRAKYRIIALTAILAASAMFAAVNAQTMPDTTFYAVTTKGELISFKSSNPGKLLKTPKLNGTLAKEWFVGIDFRPAGKMLYGVTNQSRIYTINTTTGMATAVGTLTTALSAVHFGADFNPVPDRLRITNDADQNLRANPADAANVVDKALVFAATDANAGKNPNVAASAYTNNFAGTKATTLYNIDHTLDALMTQNPPNDGVLNTLGKLGVKVTGNAGFDIVWSNETNFAVAALQTEGDKGSKLYWIDLKTGTATLIGKIGGNKVLIGLTAWL